ncbi:MAG: MBL fold metallo-hydrolase [Planctomycetes bacterium]|nr:MBL fold metallo-hydrolase [Planctomycetota bacterium]
MLCETVGPFAENSYFIVDPATREAVAIDPGDEPERLLRVVRTGGLKVRWILNTHGHLDHIGAVEALRAATGAPFHIHAADEPFVEAVAEQAAFFGLPPPPVPEIDGALEEGQELCFGEGPVRIKVFETPGHSPGSVTFDLGGVLFAGDVLFAGSIGRTDLPGGDLATLMRSIRAKLLVYPEATLVYPGHGPPTTIGEERRSNPFLVE